MKQKAVMTLAESRAARALDNLGLLYRYEEEAILRYRSGYETVRYSDFYLPELDLYVEVSSVRLYPHNEARIREKYALYDANGFDWVEIDPCMELEDGRKRLKSVAEMEEDLSMS